MSDIFDFELNSEDFLCAPLDKLLNTDEESDVYENKKLKLSIKKESLLIGFEALENMKGGAYSMSLPCKLETEITNQHVIFPNILIYYENNNVEFEVHDEIEEVSYVLEYGDITDILEEARKQLAKNK